MSHNFKMFKRRINLYGIDLIITKVVDQQVKDISKKEIVYIAKDADKRIVKDIIQTCAEKQIQVIYVETMGKLGEACKIDVSAASAALLK